MEKTQRYLVLSPLKHDSKAYRPGATVELTEFYAGPLLACAVIAGPVPQQPPASIPERNTTTNEESGDSAPDGGQEGTAPAAEGTDASVPKSESTESTLGEADPAQAGGETGAVPDAPAKPKTAKAKAGE